MINKIKTDDLRKMNGREGLILQGCGGDPQEWLDGINDMFQEQNLLQNGTKFSEIYVFENAGTTNILFPFSDNVDLNIVALAMWRLQSHGTFGGKWLSDYVENRLGGFVSEEKEQNKPDCALIGEDGNIFNITGKAARTLKQHGMGHQADEMWERIQKAGNYYEALGIVGEYVNITDSSEINDDLDGQDGGMKL